MSERYVGIGRIMGAHGVRGMVKVRPYNPESPLFVKGANIYFQNGSNYIAHKIESVAPGKKGLRVALSGIGDREQARALFERELFVPRSEFAELDDGEFYLDDLIGFDAVDAQSGEAYGQILGILETGANDCLEIGGARGLLIPVLDGVIADFDPERRVVLVALPEGLLDVYSD